MAHARQDKFLTSALVVALSISVALSVQLRRARLALEPTPFLDGNVAPTIELVSDRGAVAKLQYGGDLPIFLYWFSPSCSWCELNLPNFQALATQSSGKYRFYAVSTFSSTELRSYSEKFRLSIPLYNISAETARRYRLGATPTSVLISSKGTLIRRWVGAYSPGVLTSIESTLAVSMPGLSQPGPER